MAGNYGVSATLEDKISPALGKIQNQLKTTSEMFGNLQTALAGLAIGVAIKNAIAYADAISDVNDATGIAIQNIVGFQKAVEGAGGSSEGAQKGIYRLVNSIGEAANGSAEFQDAFAQVGVSLKDLATLSEQDILRKTIAGLSKINDVSQLSILKTQLLGKEFRGVNAAKLDETLDKATAASAKYAEAIQKAADAQDVFDKAASASKMAILDLISPLTGLANSLPTDKLDQFVGAITKMLVMAGVTIALAGMVAGFAALTATATGAAAVIAALAGNFLIIATIVSTVVGVFITLNEITKFVFDIDLLEKFKNGISSLINKVKEYYNVLTGGPKFLDEAEVARENKLLKDRQDALLKQQEELRKVADATKKFRMEMQAVTEDFNKQNKAMLDNINLENSYIGSTLESIDVTKAQEEIFKRAADASDKLRDRKEKLTESEKRSGLGAVIDQQIAKIQEIAAADAARIKAATENSKRLEMLDKIRLFGLQNQISHEQKLQSIQDDIAKSTMSEIQKKYYDIDAAAKASAKSAIEAEQARIGRPLNADEQKKYYEIALKGTEDLKAAQAESYDQSRKFSTGWQQAFSEYIDNATNAANIARSIFAKVTQDMEDLIVSFVKTGKFEFKGLISNLLEELLRSQLRQTMASIFSVAGNRAGNSNGGNFLGSIGNLLGFANGGIIPTNGPVLVGERGPEIISNAGGRVVTPNHQLGGGGSTNVTYNISAVDAGSFKSMIARDPSFIHAVAMQGAKSTPGRR